MTSIVNSPTGSPLLRVAIQYRDGQGEQLARTWQIIKRLEAQRSRGLTVDELCEEGNWNRRTLYRDIQALEEAGFPIEKENCDGRVYYRFTQAFRDSLPLHFSLTEMVALTFSQDLMRVLKGTFFYESIESALSKIKAILPAKAIQYLNQIEGSMHTGFSPQPLYQEVGAHLDDLFDAVVKKSPCQIRYHSAHSGEVCDRIVEPLKIWFANSSLYLVAFDRKTKEKRTFAISRIEHCEVLKDQKFENNEFDFEQYRAGSFRVWRGEAQNVELIFSKEIAPVIGENLWHESQRTEELEDGRLVLHLSTVVSPELENWVLSWGNQVIVRAPEELKGQILERAIQICQHYTDDLEKSADEVTKKRKIVG